MLWGGLRGRVPRCFRRRTLRIVHIERDRHMFVFFQAEDGIRDAEVTGIQTCALPISSHSPSTQSHTAQSCPRPTETELPECRPRYLLPAPQTPMRGAATGIYARALKRHVYRPLAGTATARCQPAQRRGRHLGGFALSRIVVTRPPRVQLLGLLPAILKPCGPACAQPFTNRNVEPIVTEEWHETPAFVIENADRAHRIAEDLFRDFGDRVRIEVVGFDSPRGGWLGLRHQIGKGFAVIVDGREVFRDPKDSDPTKGAGLWAPSTSPSPR